ncbi:hypothetical protein V6N12_048910 [Hibiscus sabdariffa]|uniref:Uncharacterized protein n=1 Tax=Hibiscus sabdariffa TaxID=183260 RepID=A0ABR2EIM7_9ROSI
MPTSSNRHFFPSWASGILRNYCSQELVARPGLIYAAVITYCLGNTRPSQLGQLQGYVKYTTRVTSTYLPQFQLANHKDIKN